MQTERIPNPANFDDIENCDIFIATVGGSSPFYAIKGFEVRSGGEQASVVVCLGPQPHPRSEELAAPPSVYDPVALRGELVLKLGDEVQVVPSINVSDMDTLRNDRPKAGDIVCVKDKVLIALEKIQLTGGQPYLNLETGVFSVGLNEHEGYIIKAWDLVTRQHGKPRVLFSWPLNNLGN